MPLTPAAARSLVFSAGVAAVARSDPRVPEATRDLLLTSATTDADAFDPAARDALRRLAGALVRPNASASTGVWDAWIAMLDRLTSDRAHARLRQRITLETIEMLLLGSTPPSRDRAALHAAERLAGRAGFDSTRAPVARARFLAWIDDPRVASIDLAILMRTLALPEFASIELSPSAAAAERELLRRRLAASWGMSDGPAPRERLAGSWRDARESLRSLSGDDPLDRLRRSVALARLLSAAESAWRGEIERAAEALSVATTLPPFAEGDIERGAGSPGDGRWTVEYHTVRRNGELALEAVDRAASRTLGPIDARALAKVALFGSPPAVRRRAQEVAATKLDNVHLLEGVLEQLPRAPRTPRVAELIDTLATTQTGDPRADGWMLRARRALVDRLLVALDPRDALANVDELAREIRDALAPPQQQAGAARESVAAAAAEIADRLLSEAASLGVAASLEAEEARRRRDGRRRVASGPIQLAVAETTALAEALAALAAAERPARAAEARRRIADLATLQRRAASSVEQLEAALAAAVELWALRLEFSLPPATTRAPALPLRAMMTALTLTAAPHDLAGAPLEARLAALDPAQPAKYLHLAEEVAYETPSRDGITLARRLALLAMQLGVESDSHVAASAALLLADLSPDEEQRAWLRALADTLGASAGLLRWNASPRKSFDTRLAAAEVLGLSRAEENRRAMDRFEQPAVRDALASIAAGLPGGLVGLSHRLERAPSCPECKNDRVIRSSRDSSELVLCYTCRGLPRPFISDADLVTHLRLEQYLLGGFEDWSAEITARGIEPLRDLTLPEAAAYYNVDINKTIYMAGAWRAPDSSP
jgi:hypothetical protein